jgi:hypothetical protein
MYIETPTDVIFPGTYTFSGISTQFVLRVPSGKIGAYTSFWAGKSNWQQPKDIED